MKNLSSRLVLQLLKVVEKRYRVTILKKCLDKYIYINLISVGCVTVGETWIHHKTPENKEQSK